MDASGSCQEDVDKETRDLQGLLDVFATVCSLEEIASAYCSAKGNVDDAGGILVELQKSRSGDGVLDGSTSFIEGENASLTLIEGDNASLTLIEGENASLTLNEDENASLTFIEGENASLTQNYWGSKQNKFKVSTGIVSDALGRGYALSHQSRIRSLKAEEPLKPELKKTDPSQMLEECDIPAKSIPPNKDIEDFLFSMLHDGFNLDKQKTHDVLRSCGYDVTKSMEELLSLSSLQYVKDYEMDHVDNPAGNSSGENHHSEGTDPQLNGSQRTGNRSSLPEQSDIQFAVLEALYSNTNIPREPKRTRLELGLNRKRVAKEKVVTVSAPSFDAGTESTDVKPTDTETSTEMREDETRYNALREAAKTHWDMMKTYYESAFKAFTAGDCEKANYLIERGKHHNKLAREAEEKSSLEINAPRNEVKKDVFPLDLHMHQTKEAVNLLKQHLHTLAGISSISHLKVIVDSDGEDVTKGRRMQAVMKILKKRSIVWNTEEGKPGIITIRMDLIDPQK